MVDWPSYYPPDCPDSDAEDAFGEVYLLTKNKNPIEEDFKPHIIKFPNRGDILKSPCKASGLSVSKTIIDCKDVQDLIPALSRRFICKACLEPHHGKMKHTPKGELVNHYTWWIPVSVDKPWTLFQAHNEDKKVS